MHADRYSINNIIHLFKFKIHFSSPQKSFCEKYPLLLIWNVTAAFESECSSCLLAFQHTLCYFSTPCAIYAQCMLTLHMCN